MASRRWKGGVEVVEAEGVSIVWFLIFLGWLFLVVGVLMVWWGGYKLSYHRRNGKGEVWMVGLVCWLVGVISQLAYLWMGWLDWWDGKGLKL